MTAPVLTGPRVVLRAPRDEDAQARRRRGLVADIERGYGAVVATGPMSDEQAQEWLDHLRNAATDTSWIVELDGDPVGASFLHQHSEADRHARFAIGMFDPAAIGAGIGQETTRLVLDHAFGALGLHRVDLLVLEFNARAIACYEACGFLFEGRLRDSCLIDGQWYDDLVMGVLSHEFRARGQGA